MTLRDTGWFKSSYSAGSNDACVEVRLTASAVGIRDSKNPQGPALRVPLARWNDFLATLG